MWRTLWSLCLVGEILSKLRSRPSARIDTSALPHGQEPRIRSAAHLAWIRKQRCCVPGCGRREVHAHHLLSGPDLKARGEKASDANCIPLCFVHHDEVHWMGDEQAWAERHELDVVATAAEFWRRSPANR